MTDKPKRNRAPDTRPAFIARSDKRARQAYLSPEDNATIEAAAEAAGESVSAFLAKAGLERARRVLKNRGE